MARYKGSGGAVFEIDNPPQEQLDSGALVPVAEPKPAAKKSAPAKPAEGKAS